MKGPVLRPPTLAKEMAVEFFEGPWDGFWLLMKMPPPKHVGVATMPPERDSYGRAIGTSKGPHHYDRVAVPAGYYYRYKERFNAEPLPDDVKIPPTGDP